MQTRQPSLIARDHTILGVCEGLGEDLGFNPVWLRVALAVPLFINWQATIVGYLAAGLVVLASRLIFPNPKARKTRSAVAQPVLAPETARIGTQATPELEPLPLAA